MTLMVAFFFAAVAENGTSTSVVRMTTEALRMRVRSLNDNADMDDRLHHELALLRDLGFTHLDIRKYVEPDDGLLAELERVVTVCEKCRLAKTRTQVVYGVGSPKADLMFIGEAPGRDEDIQGKPFVGRAGQLLTDIIKAMKLTRDDVYIANVIKCRPPENRNPEADELDACRPYIRKQIEFIQPKVIVTLGKFALQSLTGKSHAVSSARGVWTEYDGIRVMPTYHPAYLLRTPSAKKDVWTDMKKVMAALGINHES